MISAYRIPPYDMCYYFSRLIENIGNLPLNDIILDEAKRNKLSAGEYECVVIYDEKCITPNARLVYKTISKSSNSTRVSILKGV